MKRTRILGKDREIGYRQWIAPAPRAVFLLVHGLGAHTGRWEFLADFFLAHGISSYAIALPMEAGFNSYYSDIMRLREKICKENPSLRIFLVGESMGALASFLLAAEKPGLFSGLVCISPAFANRIKLPPSDYLKIFASLFYDPGKEFRVPFDSAMCTRDIEYRKKMDADSAERRSSPSRLLAGILISQVRARFAGSSLRTPALFLVAGRDLMIDPEATKKIFNGLASEDKALIEYPEMYHALSIDIGKEKVFEDILKWVDKRL
jgi:alpha-beta hydrolase superfamily lysophospholipase